MAKRTSRPRGSALVRLGSMIAVASLCALVPNKETRACGNEVEIRVDPRVSAVNTAERLVAAGDSAEAQKRLLAAFPLAAKRPVGTDTITDRALVVLARVATRSEGRVFHGHGVSDPSLEQREKALSWAAQTLKELRIRRPDDAVVQTDLGETLSYIPSRRREAIEVLERLESKDVVASAQGYAALAALHGNVAQDHPARTRAPLRAMARYQRQLELGRCRSMSAGDASSCERPNPPPT
ncbi:MAG: hypothetical protein HOW73_26395 [Polyangiaceae bacterium]|nr:hypothetical protein [Polyangiaceae bacterium]